VKLCVDARERRHQSVSPQIFGGTGHVLSAREVLIQRKLFDYSAIEHESKKAQTLYPPVRSRTQPTYATIDSLARHCAEREDIVDDHIAYRGRLETGFGRMPC
jgi:hypothetical protein